MAIFCEFLQEFEAHGAQENELKAQHDEKVSLSPYWGFKCSHIGVVIRAEEAAEDVEPFVGRVKLAILANDVPCLVGISMDLARILGIALVANNHIDKIKVLWQDSIDLLPIEPDPTPRIIDLLILFLNGQNVFI